MATGNSLFIVHFLFKLESYIFSPQNIHHKFFKDIDAISLNKNSQTLHIALKIGIRLAFIDMWYAVFGKWRFYSLAAFSIVGFTVKMRSGGFYTHRVTRGGPVSD